MTTTYFLSDGNDEIADYDGAGALVTRYVPGPTIDDPIAQVTAAGTKTFFHENKQGSVIAMSGNSAALAEGPYTYDPYGNCVAGGSACSSGEPYRFTGRRFDPETGLFYYRARYYSSVLGRFLQTDPVGYSADLDLYTYVGNEPVNETDPTGEFLWPWEESVAVTGGTPQQRAHYAAVVARVLSTPRGQQLETQIVGPWYWHGSPEEIKLQPGIQYGTGAVFSYSAWAGKYEPTGEIDIDPGFHPLIATTKGAIPATDERVVGHEIGHAATGTQDTGPAQMDNVNQNENPIVRALGQPARTQYAPPNTPNGGSHFTNPSSNSTPDFSQHPSFSQCAKAGMSCGSGGIEIWGQ